MKKIILFIALLCSFLSNLKAELSHGETISLIDDKSIEGYDINPADFGLPPSSSSFIVLNYNEEVIAGVYGLLESREFQEHWEQGFRTLRRIATADPSSIDIGRLMRRVEFIEQTDEIEDEEKVDLLSLAYPSIARCRNDSAYQFLKSRSEFDFWEGNEISKTVYTSHDAGSSGWLKTGQTQAISALDELQTEEAHALLKSFFEDERYASQPHLNLTLRSSLEYGWESSRLRLQTIEREYAKRLEIRSASAPIQVADEPLEPDEEQTPADESSSEASALKSEEPIVTISTPAEPVEDAPEQSSHWWLWLIGGLLIFGGLVGVIRRK